MKYQVYQVAGWHGEPDDPLLHETDDEQEASLMAGERMDIHLPGDSNKFAKYATDSDGEVLDRIESFTCGECSKLFPWGQHGPTGIVDGRIQERGDATPDHLVVWVCDDCSDEFDFPR